MPSKCMKSAQHDRNVCLRVSANGSSIDLTSYSTCTCPLYHTLVLVSCVFLYHALVLRIPLLNNVNVQVSDLLHEEHL